MAFTTSDSAPAPTFSSSPSNPTEESLDRQIIMNEHDGIDLDQQKRRYSAGIYAYTKTQWEDCRNDIERRSSDSSVSISSHQSSEATLNEHIDVVRGLKAADPPEVAGDLAAVPAIH